jgi:hypothetical protein
MVFGRMGKLPLGQNDDDATQTSGWASRSAGETPILIA